MLSSTCYLNGGYPGILSSLRAYKETAGIVQCSACGYHLCIVSVFFSLPPLGGTAPSGCTPWKRMHACCHVASWSRLHAVQGRSNHYWHVASSAWLKHPLVKIGTLGFARNIYHDHCVARVRPPWGSALFVTSIAKPYTKELFAASLTFPKRSYIWIMHVLMLLYVRARADGGLQVQCTWTFLKRCNAPACAIIRKASK